MAPSSTPSRARELPPTLEAIWALDEVAGAERAACPVLAPPTGAPALARSDAIGPGDTLAILYTSGTTGPAKGVCCPQAQFYWWGILVGEMLGDPRGRRALHLPAPVPHQRAQRVRPGARRRRDVPHRPALLGLALLAGARRRRRRPSPTCSARWSTSSPRARPVPPTAPTRRASRSRRARRRRSSTRFRERFGVQLVEGYGSTETNCAIAAPWSAQRAGYMGPVRDGFEARVVDEHDVELPAGQRRRARAAQLDEPFSFATGYFAMPEKTVEAWRNLWFHTGDRVVREGDGWFRFLDRLKDAIRRRGENISSFEVEQVLLRHPAVAAAAVFPVPSEMAEDEVAAAIVLEPGATLEPRELIEHCAPLLAYFAVPRYVEFVGALPLTENGKVRKAVLRERGITAAMWDREAAGVRVGPLERSRRAGRREQATAAAGRRRPTQLDLGAARARRRRAARSRPGRGRRAPMRARPRRRGSPPRRSPRPAARGSNASRRSAGRPAAAARARGRRRCTPGPRRPRSSDPLEHRGDMAGAVAVEDHAVAADEREPAVEARLPPPPRSRRTASTRPCMPPRRARLAGRQLAAGGVERPALREHARVQPAAQVAVRDQAEVGGLDRDHHRVVVVEVGRVEVAGRDARGRPQLAGEVGEAAAQRVALLLVGVVARRERQRAHGRRAGRRAPARSTIASAPATTGTQSKRHSGGATIGAAR